MHIKNQLRAANTISGAKSPRSSLLVSRSPYAIVTAFIIMTTIVNSQEPALRVAEPLDSIVADLRKVIPEQMLNENIPGLSIALIRNNQLVWTEGFGTANVITHRPVTSETLFEVASNSKVVTAYIALRLVDQGQLSLDEPLDSYLSEPWLPSSSPYRNVITLRHTLSHSSGLRHNTPSRENLFAPGSHYSYSGQGLLYTQTVIEQVTGQSLEDLAQQLVFEPLGMSSTSFVNRPDLTKRTANGHLRGIPPVILFVLPYAVVALLVGLIGLVVFRIRTGKWRPSHRMVIITLAATFPLSLIPVFILFGMLGLLEFAWLIAFWGLALIIVFSAAFKIGRYIIGRLSPHRAWIRSTLTISWLLLILTGLALLVFHIRNVPVPRWTPVPAGAASSLRATTTDMAAFLIELSHSKHLSTELASQLGSPQIQLANDLAWGLGPGIQHSQQGAALWQWGQHIDFQSITIIYPEHGIGVVVCTNSDLYNPDVAINIAQLAIGGRIDLIRRGSHLEFDFQSER